MPKISIVISIYNVAKYLQVAVRSALDQTEPDIEIILVDDGSTDESGRLCDEYTAQDKRVKVVHKENGGLSSARNAGVAAATAEYLLLLDGDDYLHLQTVEKLLRVLEQYPSDVVQFLYQEVGEQVELALPDENAPIMQCKTARKAFDRLYEYGGVYASGCTKLFRRELLQKIPFEVIRHEDEMWCTRAFPQNLTITYIPDVFYGYVMRQGSIIRGDFKKTRLEILTVKEERLKTLRTLGFSDLENKEMSILFSTLFTLYKDAKKAKNVEARREIVRYFKDNKIVKRVKITGRMRLFYLLAKISVKMSLNAYSVYWAMKG